MSQNVAAGRGPEGIQCRDCAPCPDLDKGLGYPGGYNPGDSPWYDPDAPESIDFAGLLVTSVTGLGPGEFNRPVIEKAGVGAIIGQGRQVAPQIVVTGLLMAATCCAMEYGLRWLSWALRQPCAPGAACAGGDLLFLSCEPNFPDEDCADDPDCLAECIAACGGNADCEAECAARCAAPDFEALLAQYYRTMKNVALTSGPTISAIVPRGCPDCYECGIYEVTFTLGAGDPCMYRDPILLVEEELFDCTDPEDEDCIVWVTDGTGCDDEEACDTTEPCSTDPNCFDTPPPVMPSIVNPCADLCIGVPECRVCVDIPAGIFPATGAGTLLVSIFAGSMALRKIRVQIWENPLGLPADELDPCDVCTELNISYVGPDSTLVIDGANRSSVISCPGGDDVLANPFIATGSGSGSFQYPSLSGCGGPYTVCISAQGPASPDATVTISAIPKEC